jgi:glycosyltransferase involved in cell wall biosynthesis
MEISVIICTRNPRKAYLDRVLNALANQSLPLEKWELIIVDNKSDEPLANRVNLDWHPLGRHVLEERVGFTTVRARGIIEAKAAILLFLDDDNVPASDYLARGLELFSERQYLGAISGRIVAEYESEPPSWFKGEYESWIAVRQITRDTFSNFLDSRSEPCSAGMVLRRDIGLAWVQASEDSKCPSLLADASARPLSGEDVEIIKTALNHGFTVGMFQRLQLTHLIPSSRVQPDNLFATYRNIVASAMVRGALGNGKKIKLSWRALLKDCWRWMRGGMIEKRMVGERIAAHRIACRTLADWKN